MIVNTARSVAPVAPPSIMVSSVTHPPLPRMISRGLSHQSNSNTSSTSSNTDYFTPGPRTETNIPFVKGYASVHMTRKNVKDGDGLTIQERRRIASLLAAGAPFNGSGVTSLYGPNGNLVDNAEDKPAYHHDEETKNLILRILKINFEDNDFSKLKPDIHINNAGNSHPRKLPRSSRPRNSNAFEIGNATEVHDSTRRYRWDDDDEHVPVSILLERKKSERLATIDRSEVEDRSDNAKEYSTVEAGVQTESDNDKDGCASRFGDKSQIGTQPLRA